MMLALLNWTDPTGAPPPLALNVLSPWPLNGFTNRMVAIVVPLAIGAMFWRSTSQRELENPSRLAVSLLASQAILAFLVAQELQFVVAVEFGLILAPRVAALCVCLQACAAWLISVIHPDLMAWIIPATGTRAQRLMAIAAFMLIAMLY